MAAGTTKNPARKPSFSSLRTRLLLLVAVAVVPVLGLTFHSAVEQRHLAGIEVQETALRLARLVSTQQGQLVLGTRQLLMGLTQLREVRKLDGRACSALFADLLKAYPVYSNLGAIDNNGRLYCSALPMTGAVNLADRPYFQRAMSTSDFAIGDYQVGRVTKIATINFGYPIVNEKQSAYGVVYAALSLGWLNEVIKGAELPKGSTFSVTDRNGTILVRYPDPERWVGKSLPGSALIKRSPGFGSGIAEASEPDGIPRLIGFTPLLGQNQGGDVYVSIGIPKDVAYAEANQALTRNLLWLAVIAMAAFAAAWFGGDIFILRRVKALVTMAKQLEKGNLSARIGPDHHGHGELGQLARTFDEMAASLQKHAVQLEFQATHDLLTGLANRRFFKRHLDEVMFSAQSDGKPLALLLMDLNSFKEINDTLGHHNGDLVLKSVTERLREVIGKAGFLARLGGDEFSVLLANTDREAAINFAQQLITAFEQPFMLRELPVSAEISVGIALYPEHGDHLIQRAEVAMYLAKQEKSGCAVYAAEKDQYSPERLRLLSDLRRALEEEQLYLLYQPKLDLRRRTIDGAEALVRWQHPRLGSVPPDQFIGMAEHTGLIRPLTYWVIHEALRQCDAWRKDGVDFAVAVNISSRNLEPDLPGRISEMLRAYDLAAESLELEITEGTLMKEPARAGEILARLRELGIRTSIDDFGTGYSSLSYLSNLPVRAIKIDRSFVMNMTTDENSAVIVRSTIELGHKLGLEVVAEGVETEEALEELAALGCDLAQGYYISRPLTAADLTDWLKRFKSGPMTAARAAAAPGSNRRQWDPVL